MLGQPKVCKYNQTGFCKYRDKCQNIHDYKICEKSNCDRSECTQRHPQECRRFKSNMECRFNESCAYKHTYKNNLTDQGEINRAVASVSMKHENEIKMFKEEIDNMKLIITSMGKQITSLMKETTEHSEANKEIEIVKEVESDKTKVKDSMGKELEHIDVEVSNKEEAWLHCDICMYKCKTENNLSKHMNTKHEGYMSCDTCGTKFSSSKTLSTHTANAHKSKENVNCGNWICMEESGSCGGFCVYDR